jgi:hypothetical protein
MRGSPTGISVTDHQALGRTLQRLQAEAAAVRRTVKAGCGSGVPEYQAASQLLSAIKRLIQVLALSAAASYAAEIPTDELRRWYNGNGDDPFAEERG